MDDWRPDHRLDGAERLRPLKKRIVESNIADDLSSLTDPDRPDSLHDAGTSDKVSTETLAPEFRAEAHRKVPLIQNNNQSMPSGVRRSSCNMPRVDYAEFDCKGYV